MFTFFIGYCVSFLFFAIALGLPEKFDAFLARRELALEIDVSNRLAVKRAVLRTLRNAI